MKMSAFWWDIEESLSSSVQHVLPAEADFVVVGGGYTGLSAGLSIARQGRSVVVLDSGAPGFGASTRNGGICSGQIRLSHGELSAKFGTDFADEAYSEGIEARLDLAKFCEEEKIECQFQMTGRFTGAMSARDYDTQAREVDRLNRVVGHKAYMVERKDQHSEIATDLFHGGMVREEIGGFHPGKFFAGPPVVRPSNPAIRAPAASRLPALRSSRSASSIRMPRRLHPRAAGSRPSPHWPPRGRSASWRPCPSGDVQPRRGRRPTGAPCPT